MHFARRTRAIVLSLVVAVLLLLVKWAAYLTTSSVSILSDAAESVVHLAATGMAAFSVWYSSQPADRQHVYGHGRIAYFSAGVEGGLVLFAALSIFYHCAVAFFLGHELSHLGVGLLLTALVAGVNLALGAYLVRVGKATQSLALEANGHHVLSDVWTTAGTLAGVGAVQLTGWVWLDPMAGALLALLLARSGIRLLVRSYQGLMDRTDADASARLKAALEADVAADQILGFHQLRHRRTEHLIWIEVHLLLPGDLTVADAHDRVNRVEANMRASVPEVQAIITSHIEPDEHESAHPDGHTQPDPLA